MGGRGEPGKMPCQKPLTSWVMTMVYSVGLRPFGVSLSYTSACPSRLLNSGTIPQPLAEFMHHALAAC